MKKFFKHVFRFLRLIIFPSFFERIKNWINSIKSIWIGVTFKDCPTSVIFGKIGLLKGTKFISVGENACFGDNLYLTAWENRLYNGSTPHIVIGNNCCFGANNHITCANEIIIGDCCLTGKWVTITDNNHGDTSYEDLKKEPLLRTITTKGKVQIGKNVWIGDKATVLSGITIGDGVVIAANSIVCKDVPSYCVVAGNPAKIIKNVRLENKQN